MKDGINRISDRKYVAHLRLGVVPPLPPEIATWRGMTNHFSENRKYRYKATDLGAWCIVDLNWTKVLSEFIGGKRVLEIMAGRGWIAKALSEFGVTIKATDKIGSGWKHNRMKPVHEVERASAIKAVRRFGDWADILLASWPPYNNPSFEAACRHWGGPIIYIGEMFGYTATDYFCGRFEVDESAPRIPMLSWPGIHDGVYIGTFCG
jgi:hypothetical protein